MAYEFLSTKFIEAMNDIGCYGHEKYGELPRLRAAHSSPPRVTPGALADHAADHFQMHLIGLPHDHFHTRRHQLAAVAFNAMMEFHFAGLEGEK